MTTSDGSTADYYELPARATQLQDLISHRDMNAQLGEIFRAAYRYGMASHSGKLRDAKKIKFYIEAEIKRLEMLSTEDDGWVEWNGGGCPVDPGTSGQIRMRDGCVSGIGNLAFPGWWHSGCPADIIAYRIVKAAS